MEATNVYSVTSHGQKMLIRTSHLDIAHDIAAKIFLRNFDIKLVSEYKSKHTPALTPKEAQKVLEDIYD